MSLCPQLMNMECSSVSSSAGPASFALEEPGWGWEHYWVAMLMRDGKSVALKFYTTF